MKYYSYLCKKFATLLTLGIIETSFILPSLNRSVAP